jgi:hypothetical protein
VFYQTRTVLVALAISSQPSVATAVHTPQQQRHKASCSSFHSYESTGVVHICTGY